MPLINRIKSVLIKIDQKKALIYCTLVAIFLLGSFVRLYDFSNRIYIGNEQGRDFFVSLVGWREWQLPMTGPWTSIGPITTGPWYWYFLIAMRFIIPHMLAPWIATTIASLLVIPIMYKIGVLLKDSYFGLILAFLAAISMTLIEGSYYLTNPFLLAFTTSLTILVFLLSFRSSRTLWPVLTGLLVGIDLQIHYQAMGLLVLLFGLLFVSRNKIKTFVYSIGGVAISAIPMAFFELNNHFFNTWHMADFYFNVSKSFYTPRRWLTFTTTLIPDLWGRVVGGGLTMGRVSILLSFIVVGVLLWKRKLSKESIILLVVFIFQIIFIRYWVGEIYVARIQYLIPWVLLFNGAILYSAFRLHKYLLILIPLYVFSIWPSIKPYIFDNNRDLLRIRQELRDIQKKYPNEKFSIYYCEVDRISRDLKDNYFLTMYLEGMYSEKGRKLAIWRKLNIPMATEECINPDAAKAVIPYVWDINTNVKENLEAKGWREESPKNLYNRNVKWWYEEKP